MVSQAVVQALIAARAIVARRGGWTQGGGTYPGPVCIYRALKVACPHDERRWQAIRLLRAALPGGFSQVSFYNDAPKRTQAEIVALFDHAINIAEERVHV